MLGKCTFEEGEKRAFKAQFSSEYCALLQKVNTVRVGSGSEKRTLTEEERKKAVDLAFSKAAPTYAALRKALSLPEELSFNLSYGGNWEETEKKTKFAGLPCYHKIKKAFGPGMSALTREQLNELGYALSAFKQDEKISEYLKEHRFEQAQINAALTLPGFSKTGNLSVKACEKLIPFLEQGMVYSDAYTAAGYDFKKEGGEKQVLLDARAPELEDITNPVVRRAVSQTIKVINGIVRMLEGSPAFVSIELARELANSFQERKKIEKEQGEHASDNEIIRQKIVDDFRIQFPTGQDILKLKLWQEQDGHCPYSRQAISYERLFESGYVDIDHIVPYSVSYNDSYRNKVLVMTRENRQKGNRLPLEYLGDKDAFTVWVKKHVGDSRKREFLLKETVTQEDRDKWKERSLNDTKYISRFLHQFLSAHLQMAPNHTGRKKTVSAVNGAVTAYLRKRWGIRKIREDGDTHHAVDAAVVACVTEGMIRSISRYSSHRETEYQTKDGTVLGYDKNTGEAFDKFPLPYPEFRKELEMRTALDPMYELTHGFFPRYGPEEQVSPIFVSRMPKRKATGPAHQETVRRPVEIEGAQYTVSKTPITKLKLNSEGEITGYYELAKRSDRLLYEALRDRLLEFGGDGAKAFADGFRKPKRDGTPGPLVKKVPLVEKATLTVPVQQNTGAADNGAMVRVDVFRVEGEGYYLVPVYVADTVKPELPSRAIVAHKPYEQWKEMREEDFVFSLYAGDLLHVTAKKEMKFSLVNPDSTLPRERLEKEFFAYYTGTNISAGAFGVENHDRTYYIDGLGVKRLPLLEKYEVDVLGNVTKVKKETRRGFR